ncbi:MAG: hypothetical protein IJA30_06725 [Bacilli bacterium]|nr:hypothetical protein [Bacilli bacterium]
MKEEKNIDILDELNKGCCMGSDAIKFILDKIESKKFKEICENLLEKYEDMEEKINKIYDSYSEDDPHETNAMNKVMTWSGIQMRTMTDGSDSKLAELLLQGLNMGIIEGRRLLNNKDEDPKVKEIMKEYVDVQEEYVEKIKEFL